MHGRLRVRDAAGMGDEQDLPVLLLFYVSDRALEAGAVVEEKARGFNVLVRSNDLVPFAGGVGFQDLALLLCAWQLALRVRPDIRRRLRHADDDSTRLVWYYLGDREGASVGTWRSQVAHSAGGRVVAGSNPAVPTFRGLEAAPRATDTRKAGRFWRLS